MSVRWIVTDQQSARWSQTIGHLTDTADHLIQSREDVHFQHGFWVLLGISDTLNQDAHLGSIVLYLLVILDYIRCCRHQGSLEELGLIRRIIEIRLKREVTTAQGNEALS